MQDVTESMFYSYGFSEALQQSGTGLNVTQPDMSYAKHVVERFNLSNNIKFNTRVININWNKRTENGVWKPKKVNVFLLIFVLATGCLSSPNYPNIEGLDDFEGEIYHTEDGKI